MICEPQFLFTDVVAKWPGSVHDSRIFRDSSICAAFENGQLDGLLLGDSGYACLTFLLTPYLHAQTQSQERYNRALTKTRVLIEQTFGVLKPRFACLSYGLRVDEVKTCRIAMACAVLHNIGIQRQDVYARGTQPSDDHPMNVTEANNQSGAHYRDYICATYFRE
ncbi:putative nuclease HARBI1 [Dreissena polymorpha]|nr:putative nuclease HARBI1 [Dreissena polymorpha]